MKSATSVVGCENTIVRGSAFSSCIGVKGHSRSKLSRIGRNYCVVMKVGTRASRTNFEKKAPRTLDVTEEHAFGAWIEVTLAVKPATNIGVLILGTTLKTFSLGYRRSRATLSILDTQFQDADVIGCECNDNLRGGEVYVVEKGDSPSESVPINICYENIGGNLEGGTVSDVV